MSFPFSLKIGLFFDSDKKAAIAFNSVEPETGQKFEKRSKTVVDINKNVVLLKISAMDSKALKASLNSYLKLFLLSEKIMEVN